MRRKNKKKNKYYIRLAIGIFLVVLVLELLPTLGTKIKNTNISLPFLVRITPTPDPKKLQQEITKEILPEKVNLGISFKDVIIQMIEVGAIDKNKFLALYEGQKGLTTEEKSLLDSPSNSPIVVTQANSGLILNLLWPLGIANKTNVLSQGPMGTQYKNSVANFASTGGWTLGTIDGGKLFNRFSILPLTAEQEAEVAEIAQNIYRPCCGNSTYFPDCNHGAAMLAFIELAVTQGMSKEEIYKKALALNSYWFPQTYVELGIYLKQKKNISWDKVDPKVALSTNYSSGQGYSAIDKQLQSEGLVPTVARGPGC